MSVEKMRLVKISGENERLDDLVRVIMNCGCFQPDSANKFFSSSMGFLPFTQDDEHSQSLTKLQNFLSKIEYTPVFSEENASKDLTDEEVERALSYEEMTAEYRESLSSLLDQKQKCEEALVKFSHFRGLTVNLDQITALQYVEARFGHLPKESINKLDVIFKECPYFYFVPCSTDKTDFWGVYFVPKNHTDEVDKIFATLLFEPFEIPGAAGTIENIITELNNSIEIIANQLKQLHEENEQLINEIRDFCDVIYSKLVSLEDSQQLKAYTVHNGHYFMLAGWVPKTEEKAFLEKVQEIDTVSVESEDPDLHKTSPPTKLKKLKGPLKYLIDPYKFYIDMYGTPSYSDIDVTAFVSITYTILFGIMFGDVGQGFVLSIVGFLMYKFKNMGLGKILIPCGISSMVFGFIFGSVFGFEEMLDPVYHALGWEGKPLHVMDSVNTVLLVAIAIGIILTSLSILINIYACIRRKHFGEAIFSQNGVVGLLTYLAGCNIASGFMNGPTFVANSTCIIIIAVGVVLLMIKEIPIGIIDKHPNWKPDSIMDFVLQNIFELLEYVLSYLSNTVSFLRVGAFVLVHSGMMMVVFSLAGENHNLFVIILGNILVIALEGLLTGIQALRLEYYEMFSRFYEGDGKPFTPFSNKKFSLGGKQK